MYRSCVTNLSIHIFNRHFNYLFFVICAHVKSNSVSDCNEGAQNENFQLRSDSQGFTLLGLFHWHCRPRRVKPCHADLHSKLCQAVHSRLISRPQTPFYHSVKPRVARLYSCLRKRAGRNGFLKVSLCWAHSTSAASNWVFVVWSLVSSPSPPLYFHYHVGFKLFRGVVLKKLYVTFLYLNKTASTSR